jgi:hypothetical protein
MNVAAVMVMSMVLVLFGFCIGVFAAEPLGRWLDGR